MRFNDGAEKTDSGATGEARLITNAKVHEEWDGSRGKREGKKV